MYQQHLAKIRQIESDHESEMKRLDHIESNFEAKAALIQAEFEKAAAIGDIDGMMRASAKLQDLSMDTLKGIMP